VNPLQVGIAVRTDDGELYTWSFNLDILSDYYRCWPPSVAYLASRGLDFYQLRYDGIPGYRLRWLLPASSEPPEWTTFTGGYHVAKLLSGELLPPELDDFMYLVRDKIIGTRIYDVKLMAREHDQGCRGPLKVVAKQLGAVNTQDGNGIAAVLTLQAFELLKDKMGDGRDKYRRQLCGIQAV
jgi:hypothetical protein